MPRRPAGLPNRLIDLSAYYNASPTDDWHNPEDKGNNLASLELGTHKIGGVEFDVRGIVQLSSTNLAALQPDYPKHVMGIHVGQQAAALHFLHGTGWPLCDTNGLDILQPIAEYVIHYADGHTSAVPIRYAEHVRNWQFWPEAEAKEKDGAQPIWKGPQERWKQHWPGWGVRLYMTTWTNPHPEVAIESLDFVSTMTGSAPFLIAITVDPPAAMAAKPGE